MTALPWFSDDAAKAMADALAAKFNSGTIKIYAGTRPTDANTAVGAQTLLATLTMGSTAFPASAASGTAPTRKAVATANTITGDTSADTTGTATWFRALKSDGTTVIMDGTIGTSGEDMNLATQSLVSGVDVEITSFTLSVPE
jgi:uncharacterized glyoxalase superfamily protein PhnB